MNLCWCDFEPSVDSSQLGFTHSAVGWALRCDGTLSSLKFSTPRRVFSAKASRNIWWTPAAWQHSGSIALRSAKFGISAFVSKTHPVFGDVSFVINQTDMASRSYVWPSPQNTGSRINSRVIGQT